MGFLRRLVGASEGYRSCPACGKWIKAAPTDDCPKCGLGPAYVAGFAKGLAAASLPRRQALVPGSVPHPALVPDPAGGEASALTGEQAVQWMRRLIGRYPRAGVGVSNDPTPEQALAFRARYMPFCAHEIEDRQPGRYPGIDATAPLSERLAEIVLGLVYDGNPPWHRLAGAVLDVAQDLVGADIAAFAAQAVDGNLASLTMSGAGSDCVDVWALFGAEAGRDVASAAWQTGYAACVGRLLLDCELRDISFPEPATDLRVIEEWAKTLPMAPAQVWMNAGTHSPLTGDLAAEILAWWVDENFRRLYPAFGALQQLAARIELLRIALVGFAIGRAHLEQAALESLA